MDIRAMNAPPLEAAVLWEMGLAKMQQKAAQLAAEIAAQVPHMLKPHDPRFAILEADVTLTDGQVVHLQMTAEVRE